MTEPPLIRQVLITAEGGIEIYAMVEPPPADYIPPDPANGIPGQGTYDPLVYAVGCNNPALIQQELTIFDSNGVEIWRKPLPARKDEVARTIPAGQRPRLSSAQFSLNPLPASASNKKDR